MLAGTCRSNQAACRKVERRALEAGSWTRNRAHHCDAGSRPHSHSRMATSFMLGWGLLPPHSFRPDPSTPPTASLQSMDGKQLLTTAVNNDKCDAGEAWPTEQTFWDQPVCLRREPVGLRSWTNTVPKTEAWWAGKDRRKGRCVISFDRPGPSGDKQVSNFLLHYILAVPNGSNCFNRRRTSHQTLLLPFEVDMGRQTQNMPYTHSHYAAPTAYIHTYITRHKPHRCHTEKLYQAPACP